MKIWAKVRFEGAENVECLIRAFFKEFNPESSVTIRGKEGMVEIIFKNQPPMELIEAINRCEVIEFYFGKALGEYSKDETEQVVANEDIYEQTGVEEETLQQEEKPKKKRGRPATKNVDSTEIVYIPQLEEISKKATSFEHFVKLVAEWLEMGKQQEFFENLVLVGAEVEPMYWNWKEMEKDLKDKNILCSRGDKIRTGRQVSEKLKKYSATIFSLLKTMAQYKDYSFGKKQSAENYTEQVTGEITPRNRVKMECMPEIPFFEETLGSVDKTQPIEDRIRHVLTAMGWREKNKQEQQEIFEIANTAIRVRKMDFDSIFLNANISKESSMKARMIFSKFINEFVSEYSDEKIKVLDFLKQLQEILIYENEIEM